MENQRIQSRLIDNNITQEIFTDWLEQNFADYNDLDKISAYFIFNKLHKNKFQPPEKLKHLIKKNFFKNLYIISEIKKIYKICIDNSVKPPVLLKGCAYLFKLYRNDLGYRQLNDIDMLVFDKKHYMQFTEILKSVGYIFGSSYSETMTKNNIKIDIHNTLINSSRIGYRDFFLKLDSIEEYILENDGLFFLDDNIDFIYCLLHSALHHSFSEFKWLTDAYLFILMDRIEIEKIKIYAEKYNSVNQLRFGLTYLNLFFELTDDLKKIFDLPYREKILKKIAARQNKKNLQYYINFLFIPVKYKLFYLKDLIFPARDILNLKYSAALPAYKQYWRHQKEIFRTIFNLEK